MRKALNIVMIVLNALLIAFYTIVKLAYYNDQGELGGKNSSVYGTIWIPISILITVLPMLAQIAVIAFLKFKKQLFAFVAPLALWFFDYCFEVVSLLGAAACLDDEWGEMALKMMGLLTIFIVLVVLSLIAFIVDIKQTRKKKLAAQI